MGKKLFWTAVWWLWTPIVYLVFYGFFNLVMPGMTETQGNDQGMMANFWSFGGFFWIWMLIGAIGTICVWWLITNDYSSKWFASDFVIAGLVGCLAGFSLIQVVRTNWDNDKDLARYYNQSTVFYTPDLQHSPQSLTRLVQGAKVGDGQRCDLIGSADVPSCIKLGELPADGWDPRVGSLDGATFAIQRRSGDVQKVSLATETLAYLNTWNGQPARWSGILDGNGYSQSLGGVSEWTGEGDPVQCLFTGDYALDRAFGGGHGNALDNLLAEKYPGFRWQFSDVWGYCDGDEPIVVVPVTEQIYFKDRTVDAAAGIIIVRGDHGGVKLQYESTVKPGEYPGPVYPESLVAQQRKQSEWAAGRKNYNRGGFGFEPVTSDVQAGNVSEYLLRDSVSGRLVWVTPLTLRNSSSELIVAYSVSPADEVTAGNLNQLSIYTLADGDPRRVNIDNLEADARNFFANNAGTFISNGGKLVEFTPVDGNNWRAYGELNGQVVYRLDISADKSISPKLVSLNNGPVTGEEPGNAFCGQPIEQLNPSELTVCLQLFADELAKKLTAQGAPSGG